MVILEQIAYYTNSLLHISTKKNLLTFKMCVGGSLLGKHWILFTYSNHWDTKASSDLVAPKNIMEVAGINMKLHKTEKVIQCLNQIIEGSLYIMKKMLT